MIERPLRIYLDTSDYSGFGDLGYRGSNAEIQGVLDYLREKKAQRLIEVRYSWVHLFEFLKDPDQRTLALRKVAFIEELCGDATFRYISDVFRIESEAAGSEEKELRQLVISDEGEWYPEVPELSLKLDSLLQGLHGKFPFLSEDQLRAFLRQAPPAVKEQMKAQMPLHGFYDSGMFEAFLSGEASGPAVAREIMKGFAKPSILIGDYLEAQPLAHKLFENFAASAKKIWDAMTAGRQNALEQAGHFERAGVSREAIRQHIRGRPLTFSAPYLGLDTLSREVVARLESGDLIDEVPAISLHYNLLGAYIRDILSPSDSMPKIKPSDPGDIMHATYLPYVDVYRTDGRFAELVKRLAKSGKTTVAPKLRELPEVIEERLAARSS